MQDNNPLNLDSSGRSYQFWNVASWRNSNDPSKLATPAVERKESYVSELSSDVSSGEDSSDGEALACRKCGGKDFRARKAGKGQKLVCTKCGLTAE